MQKQNRIIHIPELTKVIFFDLEFYVPEIDRESERSDLRANPFRPGHFLIGGSFLSYYPMQSDKEPAMTEFWVWDYDSDETAMLQAILSFFEAAWSEVKRRPQQADLMVAGIGVSRVDIGYLFSRMLDTNIGTPEKLFSIFYQLRIVELENAGIPFFKNKRDFLYPKSTSELNQKFKIETIRGSGTGVWDMYDSGDFEGIIARNTQEVSDMYRIYLQILHSINIKSVMPKMRADSFERLLSLTSGLDHSYIEDNYIYDPEEERFILNPDLSDAELYRVFRIITDCGYWNKRKRK
jgi:hypothetical protein